MMLFVFPNVPTWQQIIVFLAGIIVIATVLKELFGINMVGKRIYKGAPLAWKWIMRSAIFRKDINNKIDKILAEVQYNGGTSLKDVVREVRTKLDIHTEMLKRLDSMVEIGSLRHDIADISSDRMRFRANNYGAFTNINEAFLKFFGYTHRDIVGFNWESIIHDEDLPRVQESWSRAIKTKSRFYEKQRIVDIDGNVHWCEVVGYPIVQGGELKEFYGTVDIIKN